jgi:hypothetical protein
MRFICNYSSNGPYFSPTQGQYQAASLKELLMHIRVCMEDGDQAIAVFNDDSECLGMWLDEAEPIDDGEGGMVLGKPAYSLYRPGEMSELSWKNNLRRFKRP